jgi:hypothetical protein
MAGRQPVTVRSIAQLRAEVHRALDAGDFDRAFARIRDAIERAWNASIRRGVLSFGVAEVDELCLLVGRRWLQANRPEPRGAGAPAPTTDLYIASQLYADGGHAPLIGDFIRSMPARQPVLALTNIADLSDGLAATVLQQVRLESLPVEICSRPGLAEKFAWLIDVIARHRPDRIFLFNHPQDAVAVAACQPERAREIVFVHHADRVPSVGTFLPAAVHVDVTPYCFHCCRHKCGIHDNCFVPLIARDEGARRKRAEPSARRGLRTAAAGGAHKFGSDYFAVVSAVLAATRGWHVHIGRLSDDDLGRLRGLLKRSGVEPDRLIHVPYVPSVWRAMSDHDVDLYIGSFPFRGARTSVEVMGSGTPAAWHVARPATTFHDTHMKYAGAEVWQTVDELLGILRRIDARWLRRQSLLARRHYRRHHHPKVMAECLSNAAISSHPAPDPVGDSSEPRFVPLDALLSRTWWPDFSLGRWRDAARRRRLAAE